MTATPNNALQRTAPRVTLAAADHPAACAHPAPATFPQPARRAPQSLSLGSFGVASAHRDNGDFNEACSALADFLRQQGQSAELLWICREDFTGRRRRLFVHPSPPPANRDLYQRHFECGIQQSRGVRLDVLCFAADRACCYVWVPEDDVTASQAMLSDHHLRYGFATDGMGSQRGFQVESASSSAAFLLRRAWYRLRGESPLLQELPLRSDLQSNSNTRNA